MSLFRFSSLKTFSPGALLENLGLWWRRWSSLVFSILCLCVLGLGIFSWYWSVNMFHWSENEEREYRLSKDNRVSFQREKFSAALSTLDVRAELYRKSPTMFRDLFFGE